MALRHLTDVAGALTWLQQRGVHALCADSRRLQSGDAFIAWPGYAHDARIHVEAALQAGAAACIVEAEGVERFAFADESPIATMAGLKSACGELAAEFNRRPSQALQMLAVTGTNGKTSTAWWIAEAMASQGRRCGVIGTLGIGCPPELVATGLTTPDPISLHLALRRFADAGIEACAIEASSIGIAEHRLAGTHVDVALLTNFTQDHLDYHADMASYWQAKQRLFEWPGLRAAVVNIDDPKGAWLAGNLANSGIELWTYAVGGQARLVAQQVSYHASGLSFDVIEGADSAPVHSSLIGAFNVSNLLAVIGGLRAIGMSLDDAAKACAVLTAVPGRMQRVGEPQADLPLVVVDYAHSPDAIEKVLVALQPLADARDGELWCVFGCGGNRDRGKRPLMAAVAERLAKHVIVTSDNPRHETPSAIIAEIVAGLDSPAQAIVVEDRRAAITHALTAAAAQDVVLIAGKGHEDYQEIGDQRLPFSDAAVALSQMQNRQARPAQGMLQ